MHILHYNQSKRKPATDARCAILEPTPFRTRYTSPKVTQQASQSRSAILDPRYPLPCHFTLLPMSVCALLFAAKNAGVPVPSHISHLTSPFDFFKWGGKRERKRVRAPRKAALGPRASTRGARLMSNAGYAGSRLLWCCWGEI